MKRIISLLLTAAVLVSANAVTAQAATWVTVSSWAYNDVSNFKKEGLLPESFEDISDYTQNITRLQFAELLYSVLTQAKLVTSHNSDNFADTDSEAVNVLYWYNIMEGEPIEGVADKIVDEDDIVIRYFSGDDKYYNFYPDRLLTREEMASVLYRATKSFCSYIMMNASDGGKNIELTDINEISDWAKESVGKMLSVGMLSGMDDVSFAPKSNLTIEQAIVAVYSLYSKFPTAPAADGANINSDNEVTVQTYSNGITETKKGNVLYLKNDSGVLMEFETDIYSNIYCETVDGVIYAVAQNCYGKTDVYNAETKEMLFKIHYPVASLDRGYINVKSSNIGPMTFGLYDYNGKEILEPKYSMEEIEILKANNFKAPEEEYRAASGWIYYSDLNDGGHMYKMDSNGENKQKLSDNHCYDIEYINGWLYYYVRNQGGRLYVMNADGTHEQCLTDYPAYLLKDRYYEFEINDDDPLGFSTYKNHFGEHSFIYDDTWVYYYENDSNVEGVTLWRTSVSEKGIKKEKISEIACAGLGGVQFKDGKLYFSEIKERTDTDYYTNLYCYDGSSVTKLNDDFDIFNDACAFYGDTLVMQIGRSDDDYELYAADLDGGSPRIIHMPEIDEAKKSYKVKYRENGQAGSGTDTHVYEDISDERFTVYIRYNWSIDKDGNYSDEGGTYIKDSTGKETFVGGIGSCYRVKDILYYMADENTYERNNRAVMTYDMNTGETKRIVDNIRYIDYNGDYVNGDSWFTYTDFDFNVWRYDFDTESVSEIFPNASLKHYGKVERMLGTNTGMYKVDTDGNYSFVTDEYASDCLYVENGAEEGVNF